MMSPSASDSRADLHEICRRHILPFAFRDEILRKSGVRLEIVEPYFPLIPRNWNATLILAEAQNLAGDQEYFRWLTASTSDRRIRRLGWNGRAGIRPWDDGSLKLAIEAAIGAEASRTAVSNAVLWSLVDGKGRNRNPTLELIRKSQDLWAEMLAAMKPAHIVTAGAIARRVVAAASKAAGHRANITAWPLPSPRVMSPVSGTVNEGELLRRFPEVARVVGNRPEWVEGTDRKNRILYACFAVASMTSAVNRAQYAND